MIVNLFVKTHMSAARAAGKRARGRGDVGSAQVGAARRAAVQAHVGEQHAFLFAAPSKIPGAGLGLFTRKRLPKHAKLGYFEGVVLPLAPRADGLALRPGGTFRGTYCMELTRRPPWISSTLWTSLTKPVTVDGTSILRFANCCRGDFEAWNCGVTLTGSFVTHEVIEPGDEILIWYGPGYWDECAPNGLAPNELAPNGLAPNGPAPYLA